MKENSDMAEILLHLASIQRAAEDARRYACVATKRAAMIDYRLWAAARAILGEEVTSFEPLFDQQSGHDWTMDKSPMDNLPY